MSKSEVLSMIRSAIKECENKFDDPDFSGNLSALKGRMDAFRSCAELVEQIQDVE